MTTLTAFVANLGDLDVAGVRQKLDHPPTNLIDADLPTQWVQLPQSDEAPLTFQTNGGWPMLRAQLIIAIMPFALSTQRDNWLKTLEFLDVTGASLQSAVKTVCQGGLTWAIRPGKITVAKTDYWAVIADIRGGG